MWGGAIARPGIETNSPFWSLKYDCIGSASLMPVWAEYSSTPTGVQKVTIHSAHPPTLAGS